MNVDESGMPTAGMAEIIVAKHRNGATDTVNLRFRKEQARFMDYDDDEMDGSGYSSFESSLGSDDDAPAPRFTPGNEFDPAPGGSFGGGFNPNEDAPF